MKKYLLSVLLIVCFSVLCVCACSDTAKEEISDKQLAFKFNGNETSLPISYDEFSGYGFAFENAAYGNVKEDTSVDGHTLFSETYNLDNGIMTVLFANLYSKKHKAGECYVIGIDVAKYKDKDGVELEYEGLAFGNSSDDIRNILGEPYQNGKNGEYELFEYKLENDNYVSFIAGEEGIIEYTLAVEYPEIEFENMDVADNVTY